jgi:hypothetical protein
LRRAAAILGDSRYAVICRELNLASEWIADIPDRDALKLLLGRVEAEAAAQNGSHLQVPASISIGDARGPVACFRQPGRWLAKPRAFPQPRVWPAGTRTSRSRRSGERKRKCTSVSATSSPAH